MFGSGCGHCPPDLHMHSTASDGELSPKALVERAAAEGITTLALTDHDSVAGIAQAKEAADALGVMLIPGVELSCGAQKEIHILGYGFDPEDEGLLAFCRHKQESREARTRAMVDKLAECGKPVSYERVRELARGVVGRPHVAKALVEAGYCSSVSDAFDRFLGVGKCAYVPKEDVKVADAVAVIRKAGGVAVLAHPMELKMGETMLESLIGEWHGQGLSGVEVYHPSASNNHLAGLLAIARRRGMLVTGGSDYHGEGMFNNRIGQDLERWTTAEADLTALLAAITASETTRNREG